MTHPNTRIWLPPSEHRQVCRLLRSHRLVNYDPKGALPLKDGGTTDLYFDLCNARSDPQATRLVAGWFRAPLEHLQPDRFAEVPDALSGVAGHLSTVLRMPYLSIRAMHAGTSKKRSEPFLVGECDPGDSVVIIDDAITDGASILAAIRACKDRRLRVLGVVVLIDQRGDWRDTFSSLRIEIPVWAGMTITEARMAFRHLDHEMTG